MNVLIVEDSFTAALTLEAYVSTCGHQPICVSGGWLDCSAADQWNIDLVLLDIVLPEIDGYEIATRLRKQGLRAPIIAVTSLEDDPARRQECGIDGYLAKPVSLDALKAALEEVQLAANA